MRQLFAIFSFSLLITWAACTPAVQNEALKDVERFIETAPDSAFAVLQQMNGGQLESKADRAKYALLLSMAYDKNYIVKTDFETLQPAIDYYENHGTPTEQMYTDYYRGNIFVNQKEDALAMLCYLQALERGKASDDVLTKARILFAQGNIYSALSKFDKFIEVNREAAEYFKEAGRPDSYANCLLRVVNGYILMNDKENARSYIACCQELLSTLTLLRQGEFYAYYLTYTMLFEDKEKTLELINEYTSFIPASLVNWLTVSNAYLQIEEYDKAYEAIKRYKLSADISEHVRYYSVLSSTLKRQYKYQEALDSYNIYTHITDSIELAIFKADTRFTEERYKLEMQNRQEREAKNRLTWLLAVVVIGLLAIGIVVRSRLKVNAMEKRLLEGENEKYKLQCLQMEEERDNLTQLLAQDNNLSGQAKEALTARIALLNKFFAAYITNHNDIDSALHREMAALIANKDAFMTSTRLAFAGSHPQFIDYLERHGLTEREINYCCLYAIGLKGKEVGAYIQLRGHYNLSSIIREKLGINEHDTNLGIYIRKLLNNNE